MPLEKPSVGLTNLSIHLVVVLAKQFTLHLSQTDSMLWCICSVIDINDITRTWKEEKIGMQGGAEGVTTG